MADPARIKVTPAEEEDIVIIAGAVEPAADPVSSQGAAGAEATAAKEAATDPSGDPDRGAADVVGRSRTKEPYRETTLADLESSGISSMQMIIIAVAVVAVAAFVVWYVLLR